MKKKWSVQMPDTTIFLDYDGVLSDSLKEAYLLARFAYRGTLLSAEIDENEYEKFRQFRPKVVNSYMYYYFFEPNGSEQDEFNKKFLAKRKELMEKQTDFWKSLEKPLPFLDLIKPLLEKYTESFRILSTKNKDAIIEQLKKANISMNPNHVYGKFEVKNLSKGEFIQSLNPKRAILIDDCEENIDSCAKYNNLEGFLANWGYVKNPSKGYSEEEIMNIIKEKL